MMFRHSMTANDGAKRGKSPQVVAFLLSKRAAWASEYNRSPRNGKDNKSCHYY